MIRFYNTDRWLRHFFSSAIWRAACEGEKCVYLTFDDGPNPIETNFVLDELDKFNAKATFFCVGHNVQKHPETYQRLLSDGHGVGNHTFHHLSLFREGEEKWWADLMKATEVIDSSLVRPPYGHMHWRMQKRLITAGFQPVMWSFICYDWLKGTQLPNVMRRLKKRKGNGLIIVMHDQPKAFPLLYSLLPAILQYFSENGYEFRALNGESSQRARL